MYKLLRWTVLFTTLANIAFNYTYDKVFGLESIESVSAQYTTLLTPADYAFSIWGLIYLSLFCYAFIQILPSKREINVYDGIGFFLIFFNALSIVWVLYFPVEPGRSSILLLMMFNLSLLLAKKACLDAQKNEVSKWIEVPFSLLFGGITVATLLNISIWLLMENGPQTFYTIILLLAGGFAGVFFAFKHKDYIYPIVIAWGLISIWMERRSDHPEIAIITLTLTIILILIASYIIYKRFINNSNSPSLSQAT